MPPSLIGITGPARAGKDTVAHLILALAGGYQYSFAGPLKQMLATGLGIDMHEPYWNDHKEDIIAALGRSPRQLMQTLGTEWGRQLVHPDIWVLLCKQHLMNHGPGMVISDVRFLNEAAFVREQGRLIHVRRMGTAIVNEHVSEAGVSFAASDSIVVNNGTLDELREQVRTHLEAFGMIPLSHA